MQCLSFWRSLVPVTARVILPACYTPSTHTPALPPRLFVDLLVAFILPLRLGSTPLGATAEDVQYRRINGLEETSKQEENLGAATELIRGVWHCGSGRLEGASRLKPVR